MEKLYELTVLFHPDLEIDLDKPLKKLEEIIKNNKGEIINQDKWGKRRLSYPIKKQDFAVYVYSEVKMLPKDANKVQGLLNITDEVIRYLMVEKDLKAPEKESKDKTEEESSETKEG